MKNKELFEKTVGILVRAYQNDTLRHGSCAACAVGNLIAANNGCEIILNKEGYEKNNEDHKWSSLTLQPNDWYRVFIKSEDSNAINRGTSQLLSTGYSIKQCVRIERAFEVGFYDSYDRMFNGLMSVIDTLMQIHEATTEEATQAKELFVKIPA